MRTFHDIYTRRFILSTLVAKDLKAMYRNMALGFLWSLFQPLIMVAVLSFVLVEFFGGPPDAPALVVFALIPFNFLSYCLNGCTTSISSNSSLVKKVAFPRQILPVSVILTHLVHFGIQSLLIVAVLVAFPPLAGEPLSLNLLWLPLIVAIQIGLCLGAGLLVASLHVVYRDVQYIVDSVLTVLFWLSPVLYDASAILVNKPAWMFHVYYLNPVSGLLDSYRRVLYHGSPPDLYALGMAGLATLVIGVVGVRVFWVHEHEFADLIT